MRLGSRLLLRIWAHPQPLPKGGGVSLVKPMCSTVNYAFYVVRFNSTYATAD